MRKRKASRIKIRAIPEWAFDDKRRDAGTMAAAIALAKLENQRIRLSAETQRRLIGFAVFGKQMIHVASKDQTVTVCRLVSFGSDSDCRTYHWNDVERAAKQRKKL